MRPVLFAAGVFLAAATAATAQTTVPGPVRQVFFETESKHCTVSAAAEPKWNVLRIDFTRKSVGQNCALSEEATGVLLNAVLQAHRETGDRGAYKSFLIGSVENYAWMQQRLIDTARQDARWSKEKGRPVSGHANSYVNAVLSAPDVLAVFNEAGAKHGYTFVSVSCEKVLISRERLPADAFCWAEIRPSQ